MYDESSLLKNETTEAISLGFPTLPIGISISLCLLFYLESLLRISVSIAPGAITFTRCPDFAILLARLLAQA